MLKERTVRNIEAGVVLVGSLVAYVLVPGDILMPIAWTLLAVAVAGVFGIRKYMQKLNEALESGKDVDEITLRERQFLLTEFGVALALGGLSAFIILLIEYTD